MVACRHQPTPYFIKIDPFIHLVAIVAKMVLDFYLEEDQFEIDFGTDACCFEIILEIGLGIGWVAHDIDFDSFGVDCGRVMSFFVVVSLKLVDLEVVDHEVVNVELLALEEVDPNSFIHEDQYHMEVNLGLVVVNSVVLMVDVKRNHLF